MNYVCYWFCAILLQLLVRSFKVIRVFVSDTQYQLLFHENYLLSCKHLSTGCKISEDFPGIIGPKPAR